MPLGMLSLGALYIGGSLTEHSLLRCLDPAQTALKEAHDCTCGGHFSSFFRLLGNYFVWVTIGPPWSPMLINIPLIVKCANNMPILFMLLINKNHHCSMAFFHLVTISYRQKNPTSPALSHKSS